MLRSEQDLQTHVKNLRGSIHKKWGAENCLFCDRSHLDETMPDDEK